MPLKILISIVVITTVVCAVRASEEEGLFIPDREDVPRREIKSGEIVWRWKAQRLMPTRVVFRHDTADRKQFWLELDFTKLADPGDVYLFTIGGKEYSGFKYRDGTNEHGCRWALGFMDAAAGRALLAKIAKAYGLPAKLVVDETKGEAGSGG